MSPELTPKQQRFIIEYRKDGNAAQAAIRAGYSAKGAYSHAHRLMHHPRIAPLIAHKQAGLSREWVLGKLERIVEHCTDETYQFNPAGAIRALELIGKHLGMFKEKHEVNKKDGGPDPLAAAKAELLRRFIHETDDGGAAPSD